MMASQGCGILEAEATVANDVPKYFSDFAVKNADEHGNLATEIAKAETRLTRWTAVLVIGGLTVAVSVLTTIILLAN